VPDGGRMAVTRARVLERMGEAPHFRAALVECRLETGRTHQIRVHLASPPASAAAPPTARRWPWSPTAAGWP
ncbi:hypothetical protein CNY89_27455, partial [Amaricoccus sp. HAR-UPW-R2A-40]